MKKKSITRSDKVALIENFFYLKLINGLSTIIGLLIGLFFSLTIILSYGTYI